VREALTQQAPAASAAPLVDRHELARLLGVSAATIARMTAEGMPHVFGGAAPRYAADEVRTWLAGRSHDPLYFEPPGGVNQSGLAHLHGLTRARVTQVLNLLKLHPAILHFLRAMRPGPHARLFTGRRVRPLLPLDPAVQAREAKTLLPGFVPLRTARRKA
jgi:hypothetical protein